jgi:hypothetical protein
LILISCSSISKIKVVQQVKSTEKTTALADDSKQDFTAQVSERHPIKTGADNYTVYLPLYKEKK